MSCLHGDRAGIPLGIDNAFAAVNGLPILVIAHVALQQQRRALAHAQQRAFLFGGIADVDIFYALHHFDAVFRQKLVQRASEVLPQKIGERALHAVERESFSVNQFVKALNNRQE